MVTANQLADKAASIGMRTLQCSIYQEMVARTPLHCLVGEGLQFYFTYQVKRLGKDTPKEISRIISDEMNRRACQSPSQGLLSRALPYCTISCKLVGTRSSIRRLAQHLAPYHLRSMYKSDDYRRQSIEATNQVL